MIVFLGCIYMVQTSCVPIYFSTTHYTLPRKLPFSGQCERLSRRLVIIKLLAIAYQTRLVWFVSNRFLVLQISDRESFPSYRGQLGNILQSFVPFLSVIGMSISTFNSYTNHIKLIQIKQVQSIYAISS